MEYLVTEVDDNGKVVHCDEYGQPEGFATDSLAEARRCVGERTERYAKNGWEMRFEQKIFKLVEVL